MANTWFRLYAEFSTDPKVQVLSEVDQRRYIMLLCLDNDNKLASLSDLEVAFKLRVSLEELLITKQKFIKLELVDDAWNITHFCLPSGYRPAPYHWYKLKLQVFERDGFECQYCGAYGINVSLECDHVVPLSKGGSNYISNLKTACKACNRSKSSKLLSEWECA